MPATLPTQDPAEEQNQSGTGEVSQPGSTDLGQYSQAQQDILKQIPGNPEDFDKPYYGPASATQRPEQTAPGAVDEKIKTGGTQERVGADQVNLAPSAPGSEGLFQRKEQQPGGQQSGSPQPTGQPQEGQEGPAQQGGQPGQGAAGKAAMAGLAKVGAAIPAVRGALLGLKALGGKAGKAKQGVQNATNMAMDAAKNQAKKIAKQAVWTALRATFPIWGPPVGIALLVVAAVAFVIGIVIGIALLQQGDGPPETYSVALSGGATRTNANPNGVYLNIMENSRTIKVGKRTYTLGLEATSGGWSPEEPIKYGEDGHLHVYSETTGELGGTISHSRKFDEKTGKKNVKFEDAELPYYAAARFPYVHKVRWTGHYSKGPREGLAAGNVYAGQKIMFFNPATNLAVIGVIADWGPAPWTGVCEAVRTAGGGLAPTDKTENSNPRNQEPGAASCVEQKNAWEALLKGKGASTLPPPTNFTGRIAGGPATLAAKIGIKVNEPVIIGFPNEEYQKMAAGTVINVTESQIVTVDTLVQGTRKVGKSLPVPGVTQASRGECGEASGDMVALYYATDKGTKPKPALAELPAGLRARLRELTEAERKQFPGAWFENNSSSCDSENSVANIVKLAPQAPAKWGLTTLREFGDKDGRKDRVFNSMIKSLENGDPIIVYCRRGCPYAETQHVMVITGYDPTSKQFYWNNPFPGGVVVQKLRSEHPGSLGQRKGMDWPALYNLLGGQPRSDGDTPPYPNDPDERDGRRIFSMNKEHVISR